MSDIHRKFFKQENYELIYNIIRDEFINKMNFDIANQSDSKLYLDKLVSVMKNVHSQNKNTQDMKILNKETLKNILPIFSNHIKKLIPSRDIAHSIRDVDASTKKNVPFVPLRPQQSTPIESVKDVSKSFDQLTMERQNELNLKPKMPNFQESINQDNNYNAVNYEKQNQEALQNNLTSFNNKSEIDTQFVTQQNSMINFENEQKKYQISDEEFSDRLKKKQMDRSINFFESTKEVPQQNQLLPLDNNNSWENLNNNIDDNSRRINQRNEIDKNLYNQEKKDPKELFKDDSNLKLEEHFKNQKKFSEEEVVQKITEHAYHYSDHIVSITSLDRNHTDEIKNYDNTEKNALSLSNNELKGRNYFQIKFSPANDEWNRYPIYENNPTKPATEKEAKKGRRGVPNNNNLTTPSSSPSGFLFNGKIYPPYDPEKPNGNIIGYEEILIKGSEQVRVPQIYRNVVSIELIHLIMPLDYLNLNFSHMNSTNKEHTIYPSFSCNILSYPYLLLYIDEIDGTFTGSSDALSKAFAQLIVHRDFSSNKINPNSHTHNCTKDNGYVHLIPVSNGKKNFKTLLSTLDHLTIRILSPHGKQLNVPNDLLRINKIRVSNHPSIYNGMGEIMVEYHDPTSVIEIELFDPYYIKSFAPGNHLHIKSINTGNHEWDSFLMRSEGHVIIGHSTKECKVHTSYFIYIENFTVNGIMHHIPDNFKTINHNTVQLPSAHTPPDSIVANSAPPNDVAIPEGLDFPYECPEETPILLNSSLQNNILFRITTQEMESSAPIYGVNN